MQTCKVDEELFAEWIDKASRFKTIRSSGNYRETHSKDLCSRIAYRKTNFVLIELDGDVNRNGYGKIAGVRILALNTKTITKQRYWITIGGH